MMIGVFPFTQSLSWAVAHERAILIQNINIMEWPASLPADAVLDIFIELMQSDPQARRLMENSNQKLKSRGINHLSDIFDYCVEPKENESVQALFNQQSRILEARISIPGYEPTNWSAKTMEIQKTAFASKILKTPFLEFFLISETPSICIYKGKKIFHAYNSIVHELIHFQYLDPFSQLERLLNPLHDSNHLEHLVNKAGGEFDAFKIANSIEKRFLTNYRIHNYSTESLAYFNLDGVLIDEAGLKKFLINTYSPIYDNADVVAKLQKTKIDFIEYKLSLLKDNVQYYINNLANPELQKDLELEISKLEEKLI